MKIAIDISQIVYYGTGVARFTQGLVNSILKYDNDNQWTFFISSRRKKLNLALVEAINDKNHNLINWKIPPVLLSFLWNDCHNIGKLIIENPLHPDNFDWFITSDWTEPYFKNTKKATVVHDLTYLRYPETVDRLIKNVQTKRMNIVKKESKIIFADSYSTKQDLVRLLKIEPEKIIVNYPGVEISPADDLIMSAVKSKYRLFRPFILTVGKIEPRKNIKRLIDAFNKLKNTSHDLVIVGPSGWGELDIPKQNNIRLLGYVEEQELSALYQSCLFFIYPSLWEGFGYPVIEAMKLGVPVATSGSSSLTEIASAAALLFDPFSIDSIASSMHRLITDKNLRQELETKGKIHSTQFTWISYYERMIEALSQN